MSSPHARKEDPHVPSAATAAIRQTLDALRHLLDGDEEEQQETFADLRKSLDEDRSGQRRLFRDK
jgi:hypothetical protein